MTLAIEEEADASVMASADLEQGSYAGGDADPEQEAFAREVDGKTLYRDPPNVSFGRGIPPEADWPGRRVDLDDVAAACGDGRDWFRYWHRRHLHEQMWAHYDAKAARNKRDDWYKGFDWNETLITGIYGAGKTTVSVLKGLQRMSQGFPFFHNGPSLTGWVVEGDSIFTVMGSLPPCSRLLLDEAHTAVPSASATSIAVRAFVMLGANIRKDNCQLDVVSAQWRGIHPTIRTDVVEVVRPFKLNVNAGRKPAGLKPWNDITHFILAWHVWEGSPLNDPEIRRDGLDSKPPSRTERCIGNSARWAYGLTDSFLRVDAGAAILAKRDVVKAQLEALRKDSIKNQTRPPEAGVLEAVESLFHLDPDVMVALEGKVTPGQLSEVTGIPPGTIGAQIGQLYGVYQQESGGGYDIEVLMQAHKEYQQR